MEEKKVERFSTKLESFAKFLLHSHVWLSFGAAVVGLSLSALMTGLTTAEFPREPFRDYRIMGILSATVTLLGVFTYIAGRETAGPKPLARTTDHVINAFLAGLDQSDLNPCRAAGDNRV
jgi:hypothetical protein